MGNTYTKEPFLKMIGPTDNINDYAAYFGTILTTLFIGVISYLLFKEFNNRYEVAKPNEWLLLIENGALKRAGVGLAVFRNIGAQVVKFSSNMHKVEWKAQEMTNQRAGVEVKGFAIWGIYRPCEEDQDGPFRAFKSIPGLAEGNVSAGNDFVKQLIESIIRSTVANMSIMDVMQRRDMMRDRVRKEVTDQLKGWGIWLETGEIIACRISSQSLFEDMQCLSDEQLDFANRSEAKLSAETVRMATQSKIDESQINARRLLEEQKLADKQAMDEKRLISQQFMNEKQLVAEQAMNAARLESEVIINEKQVAADLETALKTAEAETKKRLNKSAQQLEIDKQNAQLQAERDTMKMERLVQDKAYQLAEVESNAEVKAAAAEKAMELEMLEKRLAIEKTLSPVNLQKMHLDAVQNVYAKLPLKEVKLVNMTGGQGALGGLGGLIPGLAEATKQVTGSNDVWDTMSDKSR